MLVGIIVGVVSQALSILLSKVDFLDFHIGGGQLGLHLGSIWFFTVSVLVSSLWFSVGVHITPASRYKA